MNGEASSISLGMVRAQAQAHAYSQMELFAAGLMGHSFVYILENIGRPNIQRIAKTVNHSKAWTAFTELNQRNVVSINSSA